MLLMPRCTCIIFVFIFHQKVIVAERKYAVEKTSCNQNTNEMNRALLVFRSTVNNTNVGLVNSLCKTCAPIVLTPRASCYSIWTPFSWNVSSTRTSDGCLAASLEYTFLEYGKYEIVVHGNFSFFIAELKRDESDDGMFPFSTLAFLLMCLILFTGIASSLRRLDEDHETKERLLSVDIFRGVTLAAMVFVNYGGGGYWYFRHSVRWNGVTFADLIFPWFVWTLGISIALATHSTLSAKKKKILTWGMVLMRSGKLLALGLFLNNGINLKKWRFLGVLQYLSIANMYTSATILMTSKRSNEVRSSSSASMAVSAKQETSFY
jgi:hypothetical protein